MPDIPKPENMQAETKTESFYPLVQSPLGMELVDIVTVLRGLGTPEEQVVRAVWGRIEK